MAPEKLVELAKENWILLDYGSVIVHVFDPGARNYYNLERLWADAEPVEVELEEN